MQVPEDYVNETIRKLILDKIDSVHLDLKEDISLVREDFQEFKKTCAINMNGYDKRLQPLEQTKYKLYAIASLSGIIVFIIDRVWKLT